MNATERGMVARGIVGAALMWLYLYVAMGPNEVPSAGVGDSFLRLFVSIGLICFYLLAFFVPNVLGSRSVRLPVSVALVAALGLSALLEALRPGLFSAMSASCASFLLQGVCVGFAYAQMGAFLFLLEGRKAAVSLTVAMTAAALGKLLLGFATPALTSGILKAALIASILLFSGIPFGRENRVNPRELLSEYAETRPLFSELFLISILYGFMVAIAATAVETGTARSWALGIAYLVPTAALLLLAVVFGKRIDFLSMRWIVMPAMTVVIIPLTIVSIQDGFILLAGVLALFQVLEASSALSLAEISREHGLPPIGSFVLLRLTGTIGIMMGRLACLAMMSRPALDLDYSFKAIIAGVIIVLVVWRAFVSYGGSKADEPPLLGEPKDTDTPDGGESWQVRRDAQLKRLAEERLLTERETEVFVLVATGRNAEYIGKQLYISENTVRSHIQRIYRKLDIHSQQELLDVVEQAQA